jgi:hypothetical protein
MDATRPGELRGMKSVRSLWAHFPGTASRAKWCFNTVDRSTFLRTAIERVKSGGARPTDFLV